MVTKDEQDAIPAFIVFQGCATLLGMITANGITKEVFLEAAVMDRMQLLRMSARIAEMMRHLPKEMTGGYTTEDLVVKEVVHTGKIDASNGKEILNTRYVLKYPETVVPAIPTTENGLGSDYDVDSVAVQAEAPAPAPEFADWQ